MEKKVLKREFSAQKVRDNYSSVAWFYNFWSDITESKAGEWLIDHAELTGDLDILDVGTGTGKILKRIALKNKKGKNTGVDLSPDMLKRAEKNLQKIGADIELKEGSAYKLPFEKECFDRVFVCFMIDLLPESDFEKLLLEFNRVLRNDGLLMISYMTFGRNAVTRFWDMMAKRFPKIMTDCRPIDLTPYLKKTGLEIRAGEYLVQNTFPSFVLAAGKN